MKKIIGALALASAIVAGPAANAAVRVVGPNRIEFTAGHNQYAVNTIVMTDSIQGVSGGSHHLAGVRFHYAFTGVAQKIGMNQPQSWIFDCDGNSAFSVDDNKPHNIPWDSPLVDIRKFACYYAASKGDFDGR